MFKRKLLTILASIAFAALSVMMFGAREEASAVDPLDISGTWVGKLQCKGYDGGNKTTTILETSEPLIGPLFISQSGTDINMQIAGVLYNGAVRADLGRPEKLVVGSFVSCQTSDDYSLGISEVGTFLMTFVEKNDLKTTFRGDSVYGLAGIPPGAPSQTFEACKWSFSRTDAANPLVGACP